MKNNITKYTYLNKLKIIRYSNGENLVIKKNLNHDLTKVYKYLTDHDFEYYLKPLKITKDEVYFPYLQEIELITDEKAKRLIYNLSYLQTKTTIYQTIDKDKILEEYNTYHEQITSLEKYYHNLQDMVEEKVYMMPSEYLFIRNVSLIYKALNYSNMLLDKWYNLIKTKKTERLVYCHGKCQIDHFLANDNGYFLSLENAHIGKVSEDFISFYNHNYQNTDMLSNFKYYQKKYPYLEEELLYLYLNLTLPPKIDIYKSSLNKCIELNDFYDKLKITSYFVLNNQKKKQYNEQN